MADSGDPTPSPKASITKLESCVPKNEAECDVKENGVMKCAGAYMHLKWEKVYCGNAMSNVTELVKKYDNICDECETKAKADEPNKDKCMPVCDDDHDHDHRRRLGDDHDHADECPHSYTAMYVGIFLVVV